MNWKYVACALVVVLLLWRIDSQGDALELERAQHAGTAQKLADALKKGQSWKTACEKAQQAAEAQRKAVAACMEREAQARRDQRDRDAILRDAAPRERTEHEREQVIDDETRKRAADRLNRPL